MWYPPPPCVQIFEVYGLGREVIDTAFAGTVSRIGGMSFDDLQREVEAFWAKGFPAKVSGGLGGRCFQGFGADVLLPVCVFGGGAAARGGGVLGQGLPRQGGR